MKPFENTRRRNMKKLIKCLSDILGYTKTKKCINNLPSIPRSLQLSAIEKIMVVTDFLNGDWVMTEANEILLDGNKLPKISFYFKDRDTEQKAIKILGDEVIKTACGL